MRVEHRTFGQLSRWLGRPELKRNAANPVLVHLELPFSAWTVCKREIQADALPALDFPGFPRRMRYVSFFALYKAKLVMREGAAILSFAHPRETVAQDLVTCDLTRMRRRCESIRSCCFLEKAAHGVSLHKLQTLTRH